MAEFSELSARITADVTDFNIGVSRAESNLNDLQNEALSTTASMAVLANRTDAAGDQMSQAARQAATASTSISGMSAASGAASVAMSGLNTVLTVSIVPALFAVAAAAVPVITALGGIAAIAGSIGFVGIVGAIGALATNAEQLKAEFQGLLSTIETELAPVFDLATGVLSILIGEFEAIVPALMPARNTLSQIAGLFAILGETIIQQIPAFTSLAVTLSREFLPGMIQLAEDVLPELPGMILGFVDTFRRLVPSFREAGRLLLELAPRLLDFGFAALSVVGPALAMVTSLTTDALGAFNSLDSSIQQLLIGGSVLAGLLGTLTVLTGGLSLPVVALVGAVAGLAAVWQQDIGNVRDITQRVFGDLQRILGERLPTLLNAARSFWDTWGDEITLILEGAFDILGTLLVNAVDAITSGLTFALQLLSGDFPAALQTATGFFDRFVTRFTSLIDRLTGGAFENLVNAAIMTVNKIGRVFNDFASQVGLDQFQFEEIGQVDFNQRLEAEQTQAGSRINPATGQRIQVVVEEDTDLTQTRIEEGAENVVTRRERRADRLRNRGSGV